MGASLLALAKSIYYWSVDTLFRQLSIYHMIHNFHNGGLLGRCGNQPHHSEASKVTRFISKSGPVEKHANAFQIYLACRIVFVSLA